MLIQTYNSVDSSPSPSFTVTKVATNQPGIYEITFTGGCANIIGCVPTVTESRASFTAFVDAPPPNPLVWARKDHRRITGNAALEKQSDNDRAKCQVDASAKGQPGTPPFEEIYKACMTARGYMLLPLEQAKQETRS